MSDELDLRLQRAREALMDSIEEARLLRAASRAERRRLAAVRLALVEERRRTREIASRIRSLQSPF